MYYAVSITTGYFLIFFFFILPHCFQQAPIKILGAKGLITSSYPLCRIFWLLTKVGLRWKRTDTNVNACPSLRRFIIIPCWNLYAFFKAVREWNLRGSTKINALKTWKYLIYWASSLIPENCSKLERQDWYKVSFVTYQQVNVVDMKEVRLRCKSH